MKYEFVSIRKVNLHDKIIACRFVPNWFDRLLGREESVEEFIGMCYSWRHTKTLNRVGSLSTLSDALYEMEKREELRKTLAGIGQPNK